ncbi:hypothetical protein GCM10022600_27680 [Qipengyuania pelagi]|uniref:Uncharacterized protein n=1 Tax=Qipengyuania pelagi TaxID=994320 RepID=A0A844Y4T3_9SPHN|nr:hypothetical protein [Qipengyuania pelagi]MXO52397.1 hypothetical protein [Qipengyuania pelagi]
MLRKSKLVAATAALSLAFPTAACAQEAETQIEPVKTTEEVEADVQAQTDETLSERRAELLAEATEALSETQKAITAHRSRLSDRWLRAVRCYRLGSAWFPVARISAQPGSNRQGRTKWRQQCCFARLNESAMARLQFAGTDCVGI